MWRDNFLSSSERVSSELKAVEFGRSGTHEAAWRPRFSVLAWVQEAPFAVIVEETTDFVEQVENSTLGKAETVLA